MAERLIEKKSFEFSLSIIALYREMQAEHEYVISRQLLRSATSIGANVVEAGAGQSRRDFLAKMSIARKEAAETKYWLRLLQSSDLTKLDVTSYLDASDELLRMLTAIVKTTQENPRRSRTPHLIPLTSYLIPSFCPTRPPNPYNEGCGVGAFHAVLRGAGRWPNDPRTARVVPMIS